MITAGKRGIGNAFTGAKQAVGMIHFGPLFPLPYGHSCFAEEHTGKGFRGHAEFFAPIFDGNRLFDIFKKRIGQLLKLTVAGHGNARYGRFGALDDIPYDMCHTAVFFIGKVKMPIVDDLNEFFQKGRTVKDLACMEPIVILKK